MDIVVQEHPCACEPLGFGHLDHGQGSVIRARSKHEGAIVWTRVGLQLRGSGRLNRHASCREGVRTYKGWKKKALWKIPNLLETRGSAFLPGERENPVVLGPDLEEHSERLCAWPQMSLFVKGDATLPSRIMAFVWSFSTLYTTKMKSFDAGADCCHCSQQMPSWLHVCLWCSVCCLNYGSPGMWPK